MIFLLAGASGRMGQAIQATASAHSIIPLARDAATLPAADALIDFSAPERTLALAAMAAECTMPMVSGTTGLSDTQLITLHRHSARIPVLWSANMSLGVNLLLKLVRAAAASLDERFDIEIFEMHHNRKLDAPSGTALSLGRAAAEGRRTPFAPVTDRSGARAAGSIGFSVARGGGVIGDHTVMFTSDEERLELGHRALDRRLFARGALKAAEWIAGREPGWYSMQDVL